MRARKTEIAGVRDGALVVRVAAPPVEHAANEALLSALCRTLDVPRRRLRLAAGVRSRRKTIAIEGMTEGDLRQRLGL